MPNNDLNQRVNHLEQEARMILPGIQALFGFQLVAVFNQRFPLVLTILESYLHLAAMLAVLVSAVLIMTPAAYHRQAGHHVSEHFLLMSSRLITAAIYFLSLGLTLDSFVVFKAISGRTSVALPLAGFVFAFSAWTWLIFPRYKAASARASRDSPR